MKPTQLTRNGFILRAVHCTKCDEKIIHPKDDHDFQSFMTLRKKEFNVKMRFVGNSYAVSIPKEIVNFIKEHERIMNDMVKMCFEEFGTLRLNFGSTNGNGNTTQNDINETKLKKVKIN
ncbi:MAG: hypothetical protein RL557_918 [archaeon]